jgi:predicted alternative tryptophan synthase beta-subunit
VNLPSTQDVTGEDLVVINAAAANSMNVFPAVGEKINAAAANAAFAMAANKTAVFYVTGAGQWHALLTA